MPSPPSAKVAIYVDRSTQQWVVRDPDGNFWKLPPARSWKERQPYHPDEQSDLEMVPGHYRYLMDLPF